MARFKKAGRGNYSKVLFEIFFLPFCLLGILQMNVAHAGLNHWTSIGPEGGTVQAIAINPLNTSIVYAGTQAGEVFKSTDGGTTWNPVGDGPGIEVTAIAIDPLTPTTVYVGRSGGGVFKSLDSGTNWTAANNGLTNSNVQTLAIDPVTPTTVYAGTSSGVFKSTDGGTNWSPFDNGLPGNRVYVLAIDPTSTATLYAGGDDGAFKSTNGGGNWNAANNGLADNRVSTIAINPATPGTVYAGTLGGGVFKSTDGGASWAAFNNGLGEGNLVKGIAIDPLNTDIIYAALWARADVYKSIDGGASWGPTNTDLRWSGPLTLAIDPSNPLTVYVGTSYEGVYKTIDGFNWTVSNSGLNASSVPVIALDPLNSSILYASALGIGLHKSTDAGMTWSILKPTSGDPGNLIYTLAIDPINSLVIYAGDTSSLYKSADGGVSWQQLAGGPLGMPTMDLIIDPATTDKIYAGAYGGGVFKSSNGGADWTAPNNGLTNLYVEALVMDPFSSTTLYAGTYGGEVFKSTDGAENWTPANNGLTYPYVVSFAIDPVTPNTVYAGTLGGGVFKTTDGGANWIPANNGLVNLNVETLVIDHVNPSTVYAGTWGGGVFKTTDGGDSWSAFNYGLAVTKVISLLIDPASTNTVYAGTFGGGIFKIDQEDVVCTYSITPSDRAHGSGDETGTVDVTSPDGCNWTATSNNAWITVTSGSSGNGNGTVGYSVSANASTSSRTGTLNIAGQTFTVTQDGTVPSPIILTSPSDQTYFDACSLYSLPSFAWNATDSFKSYEIQFSSNDAFGSISAKVKTSATEVQISSGTWKKILLIPGPTGGSVYWRVVGTRTNKTQATSSVFSILIEAAHEVENSQISPTNKGSLPTLSWINHCNMKFKIWFGNDSQFSKRKSLSFNLKNLSDTFAKTLTSSQWGSIRKLVGDTAGSTIYWKVESWDTVKRHDETAVMSFALTD